MRDYNHLDVSIEDDVFRIAFDRPEVRNAVNLGVHEDLSYVFRDAYESDARVVVLTGNGKAFSAGADFGYFEEMFEKGMPQVFQDSYRKDVWMIRNMLQVEKPIVGKINGDATGLGATLALFCDITVMSEDARIGDTHVTAGLVGGDGCAIMMPLLVGMNKAKELMMMGDLISAEEAGELGLVNYVVPPDELDDKVDEVVDKLASGPQLAMGYTKLTLNKWLELAVDQMLVEGLALEALSFLHEDHKEAVDAFQNKRRPDYPSGRSRDE